MRSAGVEKGRRAEAAVSQGFDHVTAVDIFLACQAEISSFYRRSASTNWAAKTGRFLSFLKRLDGKSRHERAAKSNTELWFLLDFLLFWKV